MRADQRLLAQEFLAHAVEFVDAAERLWRKKPFLFHPTFYCVLHGVELALKSHLAAAGYSKRQLASKALGHSLASLLTNALKSDGSLQTRLNARDQRAIKIGAKSYFKKRFEYPELSVTTLPIGQWIQIARKLIQCADSRVRLKA
jgi:hypothetical protein